MSYDLHLYRKNKVKEPFKKSDFTKLDNIFITTILSENTKGQVLEFSVRHKEDNEYVGEFFYQNGGYYWTYISYSATQEQFDQFLEVVHKVASTLQIDIEDPQISEDIIDSDKYQKEKPHQEKIFNFTQRTIGVLNKRIDISLAVPTTYKYFIKYLITSVDPKTNKRMLLTMGNNLVYCSKVNPGETLGAVIGREIPELTGSPMYKMMDMEDGGTDFDKHGNEFNRANLIIEVSFFNPAERKLKYNCVWEEIDV